MKRHERLRRTGLLLTIRFHPPRCPRRDVNIKLSLCRADTQASARGVSGDEACWRGSPSRRSGEEGLELLSASLPPRFSHEENIHVSFSRRRAEHHSHSSTRCGISVMIREHVVWSFLQPIPIGLDARLSPMQELPRQGSQKDFLLHRYPVHSTHDRAANPPNNGASTICQSEAVTESAPVASAPRQARGIGPGRRYV